MHNTPRLAAAILSTGKTCLGPKPLRISRSLAGDVESLQSKSFLQSWAACTIHDVKDDDQLCDLLATTLGTGVTFFKCFDINERTPHRLILQIRKVLESRYPACMSRR